jgi:hypothetical protein
MILHSTARLRKARDALLLEALRRQIAFMRAKVPFWRERLAKVAVDQDRIETMADLAHFPILSKEELRSIRPAVLLPNESLSDLRVCRWTSGTSGRPTVNFWTKTDWAALVASTARMLVRQAPMQRPTVFNGYSQSHVTGFLYNAVLHRLGGVVYDRSHHPEEYFSTLAQMEMFDFDTLILPERTKPGKGVGLANLFRDDPNLLARHGVRWWIGSSGTFDAESLALAREQGLSLSAISTVPQNLVSSPFPVRTSRGITMSPKVTFWSKSSTGPECRWGTENPGTLS